MPDVSIDYILLGNLTPIFDSWLMERPSPYREIGVKRLIDWLIECTMLTTWQQSSLEYLQNQKLILPNCNHHSMLSLLLIAFVPGIQGNAVRKLRFFSSNNHTIVVNFSFNTYFVLIYRTSFSSFSTLFIGRLPLATIIITSWTHERFTVYFKALENTLIGLLLDDFVISCKIFWLNRGHHLTGKFWINDYLRGNFGLIKRSSPYGKILA